MMQNVSQNYDNIIIRFIGSFLLSQIIGVAVLLILQSFFDFTLEERAVIFQIQKYLLPAMIFTIWHIKSSWKVWYGFNERIIWFHVAILLLLLLAAYPIAQVLWKMIWNMVLSDGLKNQHIEKQSLVFDILTILEDKGWGAIILVLGVLPAVAEEWVFRGIIQKAMYRPNRSHWPAIVISAIIFAGMHGDWIGLVPRVYLGIILGLSYSIGRNIWVPICLHAIYNIGTVIVYKLHEGAPDGSSLTEPIPIDHWILITSIVISILCFVVLSKLKAKRISTDSLPLNEDSLPNQGEI